MPSCGEEKVDRNSRGAWGTDENSLKRQSHYQRTRGPSTAQSLASRSACSAQDDKEDAPVCAPSTSRGVGKNAIRSGFHAESLFPKCQSIRKPPRVTLLTFANMRLLRLRDVEIGPNDRVFRHPRLLALIVWLAGFVGVTAMLFNAYTGKFKAGYIFGPFFSLFLLLTLRFVTARFHPSNWLVRTNDTGLYVQYRSYLNYEFPADDPSVVFISYGEIASARLIHERVETPDAMRQNTTQTQYLRYVELELTGDPKALAGALDSEQSEEAPVEKHWYGSSATLYRDYPVTMTPPPFLRIHWNVAPGAKKFLEALRPYTVIADPISLTEDFTRLQYLNREQQQEKLRDLVRRGQTITAVYLARQLYGCGLTEAKQMVDGLQRARSAGA